MAAYGHRIFLITKQGIRKGLMSMGSHHLFAKKRRWRGPEDRLNDFTLLKTICVLLSRFETTLKSIGNSEQVAERQLCLQPYH